MVSTEVARLCLHCGQALLPAQEKYCCEACKAAQVFLQLVQNDPHQRFRQIEASRFLFLDDPSCRQEYAMNLEGTRMRFYIEGLHCAECVQLIESLPQYDPELLEVRLDWSQSSLVVELKNPQGSFAKVAALLEDMGYTFKALLKNDDGSESLQKENRQFLIRVGVSASIAMNVMMFSVAIYAGLDGWLARWIHVLNGVLLLPMFFYTMVPFYQTAWVSVKNARWSVDIPILIAAWGGYLFSWQQFFSGHDAIYFDSLAGFLTLILVARYWQSRLQKGVQLEQAVLHWMRPSFIHLIREGKMQRQSWSQIKAGDIAVFHRGDVISVDGALMGSSILLDESALSGESLPKPYHPMMQVKAGSRLLSTEALVRVQAWGDSTSLGKILKEIRSPSQKSDWSTLSDKASRVLMMTVTLVGALFLVFADAVPWTERVQRVLALWIVACPCALAFGTPVAFSMALKKAAQAGILIKNHLTLDRLLNVQDWYFDKTGTLTYSLPTVRSISRNLSEEEKNLILSMEQESHHPIAFAFRTFLGTPTQNISLPSKKEIPGMGVVAEALDSSGRLQSWTLKGIPSKDGGKKVGLFLQDQIQVEFELEEGLLPGVQNVLQAFQKKGKKLYLLSGDQNSVLQQQLRSVLPFFEKIFAEKMPWEKKDIIQQAPCVFVGDGVNDSAAMKKATVSIAVSGSVESSLAACDVYLTRPGLKDVWNLFQLSVRTHSLVRQILMLSFVYNLIAGIGSLAGWVNPLSAAILMPISSGFLIFVTWIWGRRMKLI